MSPAASALATTGADRPVPTLAAHPAGRQGNGPLTLVWQRPAGETRCRHDFAEFRHCSDRRSYPKVFVQSCKFCMQPGAVNSRRAEPEAG